MAPATLVSRGVVARGGGRVEGREAFDALVDNSGTGVHDRVNQRGREAGPPSRPSKRTHGATAASSR